MHSITAFIDAQGAVVERFVSTHESPSHNPQRIDPSDGVTIVITGRGSPVVRISQEPDHTAAAFGSAAPQVTPDWLRGALSSPPKVPEDAADIVALATTGDSRLLAITGSGAHRLFRRKLPSGGTVLSTHLGSVVSADAPATVDRSYEDFFLGFGFHPDGRTMFQGVDQLPTLTRWDPVDGHMEKLSLSEIPPSVEFDTGSKLIDLLMAATSRQTEGTDHCAVLLGGFDSALVCALLKELGKKVTAFTFDFGDERFNQPNIDMVRDWLGIDHHWVGIDAERMIDGFAHLPQLLNAPGAQPHYQLHTVFASEEIGDRGFHLAMTGDGCDAIFLGYPTIYRRSSIMKRLQRLPELVSRAAIEALGTRLLDQTLGHVARMGRSALGAAALPYPASGHLPTQYLDSVSLARLRRSRPPEQAESIAGVRRRLADGLDTFTPAMLAFRGYSLTGASRVKVDGSVMHAGVAQATPFKDPAVARFADGIPEEELRPKESQTHALGKRYLMDRVIESGLLPPEVVTQQKQSPSTSPIDYWYMGELYSQVLQQLESLPFEWNRDYVVNLLRPKRAEEWYRNRIALSPHALQAIGLLLSYAAFARLSRQ